MARPSTSGLPFLVSRGDSKKFAYWRIFPKAVGPHLVGSIERPWTHAPFALTGKAIIKLSLNTTDQAIAQARWAQIHGQVETLYRKALDLAGETNARSRARRTATLTSAEIADIAEQARHDILAAHDAAWVDPDDAGSMTAVANGLLAAMRRTGADETPQARERAQALGHRLESAAVRASLADRSLGDLDAAPVLLALTGEYASDDHNDGDRTRIARPPEDDRTAPPAGFRSSVSAAQAAAILRAQAEGPESRWSVGETVIAQNPGEIARRLQENGIDLVDDSPDRRKLGLAILRAKAGALRDIAERDRGGGIATPARPEPVNPPSAPKAETKLISQMLDIWTKRKRPTRKTVDDARLYVGHFIAMHGDLEVGKVTRALVRAYRDRLAEFPRAMPNALIGKGADAIVAWAQANPEVAKLAPQTVNAKGLGAISKLMRLALNEGYVDSNPCSGLALDVKPGDVIPRRSFSLAELTRLFSSPIYGTPRALPRGGGGAAAFWMPLIALFAGARAEEIGQLLTSDIRHEHGVDFFDITTLDDDDDDVAPAKKGATKTLKTAAGKRRAPIHQTLIDIGFLDYVAEQRRKGAVRLFPELLGYRDRYTKNWSRWWGRYQDKYVTAARGAVFHSFRHTFMDGLRNNDVDKEMIKALVGHAATDVTDRYGDGYWLKSLNAAIQKVDYPGLNLRHLFTEAAVAAHERTDERVEAPV